MIGLAALMMGLAVLVCWGAPAASLLDRVRPSADLRTAAKVQQTPSERVLAISSAVSRNTVLAGAGTVVLFGLAADGVQGGLRALLIAEVVVLAVRAITQRARRQAAVSRDAQWQEACEILATELRAGRSAEEAVTTAAQGCDDLRRVVRTMQLGGDVVASLREIEDSPAATGLASAWATAHASGAGLAGVIERVADELTEQLELRREVDGQLAAPRATARLLALLPLGGMGLGVFLGVDPVAMLLGTTIGLCCLVVGSVLAVAGVVWVDRLTRGATVTGS